MGVFPSRPNCAWFCLQFPPPVIPLSCCLCFQQRSSLLPSPAITVFSPINNPALLILPRVRLQFFNSIVTLFKVTLLSFKPTLCQQSFCAFKPCSWFKVWGLRAQVSSVLYNGSRFESFSNLQPWAGEQKSPRQTLRSSLQSHEKLCTIICFTSGNQEHAL